MGKRGLSEADICDRFITPALMRAGWSSQQWKREYSFTDGKIIVRGKLVARGKPKRVDYLLFYKPNLPIALIEAKNNDKSVDAGMQQGLAYARALEVPFVFSSNGDEFLLHDRTGTFPTVEQLISLDDFPTPDELWERYKRWRGIQSDQEAVVTSPNYAAPESKAPRYYQQLAINRTVEAIAAGERRLLLVMATGTGKTYTAFNIIWRLWKTGCVKRVLFLADRTILVDQTMVNDFKAFGAAMTKLDRSLVDKATGRVDTSYEVYLALYQAIMGTEDRESVYGKFPKDFFDLIVVDECHRGSARDDSAWREILNYFSPAVQIGMTATPRETEYVSNIEYFGEPVYSYSLKQGIDDGFLAPYKVIKVDLDHDLSGWRPAAGQVDDSGAHIEDRIYNQDDFDRSIVFPERVRAVARRITSFMHSTDPMNKAIVFCENVDHAERMRQALLNDPENRSLVQQDDRYVMRITGDNLEGKAQLDNFINPKSPFPVIATTSKLMSTGVDAQTCQIIVLDRRIQSLTEFKQIIGRGTRLRPDYGKYYFVIIDFRGATDHFSDESWDGPPIQVYEARGQDGDVRVDEDGQSDYSEGEEIDEVLEDGGGSENEELDAGDRKTKYVVSGVSFTVAAERVQFYDKDGKRVTESLRDHTRKIVRKEYASLGDLFSKWNSVGRKSDMIGELIDRGVLIQALEDSGSSEVDIFDVLCHIAFDQPLITRRERAERADVESFLSQYGPRARKVMVALLEKYVEQGVEAINEMGVLKLTPFSAMGTPVEIIRSFGSKAGYLSAVRKLENLLYKSAS